LIDVGEVIAIIKRRQAKFHAQIRSGPQEKMDELAVLIEYEYDALLAEIELAGSKNNPEDKKLK
jgi:hypothetical protein